MTFYTSPDRVGGARFARVRAILGVLVIPTRQTHTRWAYRSRIWVWVVVCVIASLTAPAWSQNKPAAPDPGGHYAKGVEALDRGEAAQAIASFSEAVRASEDVAQYRYALAMAYLMDQQSMQAWYQLRQAVRLDPNHPQAVPRFNQMWRQVDTQGTFNVGRTMEQVAAALGKPDRALQNDRLTRWLYGFMSVEFEDQQVYAILDWRRGEQVGLPPAEGILWPLDPRDWAVGYRARTRNGDMLEYTPPGQTVQDWSQMATVQSIVVGAGGGGPTVQQFLGHMQKSLQQLHPGVQWRVIQTGKTEALYEWSIPAGRGQPAQHEVARLIQGRDGLYRIACVAKVPKLSSQLRTKWIQLLEQATLETR